MSGCGLIAYQDGAAICDQLEPMPIVCANKQEGSMFVYL